MFREMRRDKQSLSQREIQDILYKGTSGVLALSGDDGFPYAVPISYVYEDEKIYFHSAKSGHKLDAIKRNEKASFCVVDQDQIIPEEYTTYYRSVIVFGSMRVLTDEQEKRLAIEKLAKKYAPHDDASNRQREINQSWESLCMLEMTIHHSTGKAARELTKNNG